MQNITNLTLTEEKQILELREVIEKNNEPILQNFEKKLSIFFLGIQNTLEPTNYYEIAKTELASFNQFLRTKDINVAISKGTAAAESGLSEEFILSCFSSLCAVLLEYNLQKTYEYFQFIQKVIFQYMIAYLSVYIQTQYKCLNKEQEQLYEALCA